MKKITLLFVCFLAALACHAASFDETQLIGRWKVTSATGNWNNQISSFNIIQLCEDIFISDYDSRNYVAGYIENMELVWEHPVMEVDYLEKFTITDFFISNGNKLHINFEHNDYIKNPSIRLIIKELNDETMTLESFDGSAQFVLTKESAAVQSIQADAATQSTTIYDVQGRPVSNIQKGNIYIQGNNKFIAE